MQDYNERIKSSLVAETEARESFQEIITALGKINEELTEEERSTLGTLSQFMNLHHSMDTNIQNTSCQEKLLSLMNTAKAEPKRKSILFCGDTSCGKTTALNLLLGLTILPMSNAPVTKVLTRIRYSEDKKIITIKKDKTEETTTHNEHTDTEIRNELKFIYESQEFIEVEIQWPIPLLKSTDIVIIDSPGFTERNEHFNQRTERQIISKVKECFAVVWIINSSTDYSSKFHNMIKNVIAKSHLSHESFMFVCTKWDQVGNGCFPEEVTEKREQYLSETRAALQEATGSNCNINLVTLSKAHKSVMKRKPEPLYFNSFAVLVSSALGFQMEPLYKSLRRMIHLLNSFLFMVQHQPDEQTLRETTKHLKKLKDQFPRYKEETLEIADSVFTSIIDKARTNFISGKQEICAEILSRLRNSPKASASTAETILGELIIQKFTLWFRNEQQVKAIVQHKFEECREHLFLFDSQLKAILNHLGISNNSTDYFWEVMQVVGILVAVVFTLPITIPTALLISPIFGLIKLSQFVNFNVNKESYVKNSVDEMEKKYDSFTRIWFQQIPEYRKVLGKLEAQESNLKLLQNYVKGISRIQQRDTSEDLQQCRVLLDKTVIAMVSVFPKTYHDCELTLVKELVGGGGNGNIASAQYRGMNVAIKTIKCADSSNIATFYNEINVMRKMKHPNLLHVLGFSFKIDAPPFHFAFISKFHQKSLKDWISEASPDEIDLPMFFHLAIGIAAGLRFLHSHDYVHRDLKPANIMLDEFNVIKIIDFGSTKTNAEITQTPGVSTLAYSEAGVTRYSPSYDVYSFGLIMFELWYHQEWFNKMTPTASSGAFGRPMFDTRCPDNIHNLILSCFATTDRPSAKALHGKLLQLSSIYPNE